MLLSLFWLRFQKKEKKTNNRDAEDFVIRNSILGNTVMELDTAKYDCVDWECGFSDY